MADSLITNYVNGLRSEGTRQGVVLCPPRRLWVCAVVRRRFPVGARPTRRSLQPEATGAVMPERSWR